MSGSEPPARAVAWPQALLAIALVWTVIERVPLVMNAETHLDSDLAVDGLTLIEATQGHWRWHFPGTPTVGSAPLLLLAPIAIIWGLTPESLGIGGVLLACLVVASTFRLARVAFGPEVAAWSLIPLAFASTGTLWLSGRITGGHLLAVAWHAIAFAGLHANLRHGGKFRAAGLGVWCGLGLWIDSMFLISLLGLVAAGSAAWTLSGRSRTGLRSGLIFTLAVVVGLTPKLVGDRVDPHDAYRETFVPDWNADVLLSHAKTLGLDCLPRLLVGHRLPDLEAEPGGFTFDGRTKSATRSTGLIPIVMTALGLVVFLLSILSFAHGCGADPNRARWAVRWGLSLTSAGVVAGFILNRNIYNSDNYRYLVFLLVPAAVGFGRTLRWLSMKGQGGAISASLLGLLFVTTFTLDLAAWYRQFGWMSESGRPIHRTLDDPMLDWLNTHSEVRSLFGDYWDVYRYAMLTEGRVVGVPSPRYPNRFPEWSSRMPAGRSSIALARPNAIGAEIHAGAIRDGGTVVFSSRGGVILEWP